MGWETFHLTGSKHAQPGPDPEEVDGLLFHRTPRATFVPPQAPVVGQYEVVQGLSRRLDDLIRDVRPDILHAHSPALGGLAALRAGRKHDIPVVYECRAFWEDAAVDHGTTHDGSLRYRVTRALETRVFRQADAVTCICEGLRQDIEARGIDAGKITVIPNAVDVSVFGGQSRRDTALADRLGLGEGPVLGFLGSFYAYEGLDLAIAALPRIREAFPGVKLLLVGGGFQEENLKAQARSLGLEQSVVFAGRVPHAEVQRYYDLVDILVYPRHSKRITELVTPLKPLEAMAQRRLLVASDVGGHRELIRDGETGRLFRAGDAGALAGTVVDLLEAEAQWERYREAGRAFVERERTWQDSVARYRAVYSRLSKM
jgi:PEP-CTERM/exosortase A-associated glycosyltransferase